MKWRKRFREWQEESFSEGTKHVFWDVVIPFLFFLLLGLLLYFPAPVIAHGLIFEWLILHLPYEIVIGTIFAFVFLLGKRYVMGRKLKMTTFVITILACVLIGTIVPSYLTIKFFGAWIEHEIYLDSQFVETSDLPHVSTTLVQYTPKQVAREEILRRTQTSEFTPGQTRAIGSPNGIAYIAPLVPQGFINTWFEQNEGFMYFEDGGLSETARRVHAIQTNSFEIGEGMEITDDIYRLLVKEIGFFKTYPEIYYAPGDKEVIGVVPYLSYHFSWGLFIPQWGGVAIFHADGRLENLTPDEAKADVRLKASHRAFPEALAKRYVEAQRYDQGVLSGLYRRSGKIEIPELTGAVHMPYFLPMEDGSYQYLTMVEPDGDAFSLMRIYMINALTGERQFYRFDRPDREQNLQGPAKVLSYVKNIPGYNWYEDGSGTASGSYRIVETRPVTRKDRLYYMLTIVPVDFARVVATVFVDAETNQVIGPLHTRSETFHWLNGTESADRPPTALCSELLASCEEIETQCTHRPILLAQP